MVPAPSPSFFVGGTRIDAVDLERSVAIVAHWIAAAERHYVVLTNAHGVVEMQHDEALRQINNAAGLVLPDGMPIVWLAHWRGLAAARKVTGAPLMDAVIGHGIPLGYRHFLYGGGPGLAERLARRLEQRHPGVRVVGTFAPPFADVDETQVAADVDRIERSACDVVWVGLGCPKQERWMARFRPRLSCPVLVGVGAAFDFLAGSKPLAPAWVQQSGFEWAFRLASEPRRLWPRYSRVIPRFMAIAAREVLGTWLG
jgi:N-acetylglucosaminyldiphosphoundecaprenol N-acetyl-beta-D-mannosaminyltransferase